MDVCLSLRQQHSSLFLTSEMHTMTAQINKTKRSLITTVAKDTSDHFNNGLKQIHNYIIELYPPSIHS